MTETNRRHFPRKNTRAAVQVLIVPANPGDLENRCEIIPAEMANQSEEGLYLETHRALQVGSNVTIRIDGPADMPTFKNAYHMHDGRIMWCNQVAHEPPRFAIGVKILRKAVQADIIYSRLRPSGDGSTVR
jgi:hypothetical protein